MRLVGSAPSSSNAGAATGASAPAGGRTAAWLKQWPKMSGKDIEETVDSIALALYSCNLPHSLLESKDFKAMLLNLAPWMEDKLPSRKQLATTLLDKCYQQVKDAVTEWLDKQASYSWASNMHCNLWMRLQHSLHTRIIITRG
jgi:hypothetical protein